MSIYLLLLLPPVISSVCVCCYVLFVGKKPWRQRQIDVVQRENGTKHPIKISVLCVILRTVCMRHSKFTVARL